MSVCEHPSEQITSVRSLDPCLAWRAGLFLPGPSVLDQSRVSSTPPQPPASPPQAPDKSPPQNVVASPLDSTPQHPEDILSEAPPAQLPAPSSSSFSTPPRTSMDSNTTTSPPSHPQPVMITVTPDPPPPPSDLSQAMALVGDGVTLPRRKSRRSSVAEEAPPAFLCPILQDVMSDPVVVATGQTYERDSIHKWITAGHRTCPVTGLPLSSTVLLPNYALRHAIQSWASKRGVLLKEPQTPPTSPSPANPTSGVGTHYLTPGASGMGVRRQDSGGGGGLARLWSATPPSRTTTSVRAVLELFRIDTEQRDAALRALCDLASSHGEAGRAELVLAGGVPPLVALVQQGEPSTRDLAARCIRYLCRSSDPFVIHAASAAIPFLVNLLSEGTTGAREAAAGAIVNLSAKADINKLTIVAARGIAPLVAMLDANAPAASAVGQEVASAALCNLAADEANRAEIAAGGAIPLFVHLVLHGAAPGGGEYSAHALGSLACNHPLNAVAIIQAGAVPALLRMVGLSSPWGEEAGTRALRNLSAAAPHHLLEAMEGTSGFADLTCLVSTATQRAAEAAEETMFNLRNHSQLRTSSNSSSSFDASEESPPSSALHSRAGSASGGGVEPPRRPPRFTSAQNLGEYSGRQHPVRGRPPPPPSPRVQSTAVEAVGLDRTASYPPSTVRRGNGGQNRPCRNDTRTASGSGWAPPRAPTPMRRAGGGGGG